MLCAAIKAAKLETRIEVRILTLDLGSRSGSWEGLGHPEKAMT